MSGTSNGRHGAVVRNPGGVRRKEIDRCTVVHGGRPSRGGRLPYGVGPRSAAGAPDGVSYRGHGTSCGARALYGVERGTGLYGEELQGAAAVGEGTGRGTHRDRTPTGHG